jgi:Integrase core domain
VGKASKSAVGTLVERATHYVLLLHLPHGKDARAVDQAMRQAIATLPDALFRSITWDQGKEMSGHAAFTLDTGIAVYFCDPHSPWQRGSNENTNGLLRQYMPKGTDRPHSRGPRPLRPQPQQPAPQDPRIHETIREARRASCAHRLNPPVSVPGDERQSA